MQFFGVPFTVFNDDALQYLNTISGKRALIVTDRGITGLGLHDLVVGELKKAGIESRIFDGVEPDPSIQCVGKCTAAAADYKPDWIVGLGGGSSMDTAKSTLLCYATGLSPLDVSPSDFYNVRVKAKLICIPTTSGTGSEATPMIVLTDTEGERKIGLLSFETLPDVALLDPRMVTSMPPQITGDTGMDALCHAIEGYITIWRMKFTDAPGIEAVSLIFESLKKAYDDGKDAEARKDMMYAAHMAGTCIGNGMAGLGHSMGHALGGLFHIPHGRAVGLFLPYTLEYLAGSDETASRLAKIARYCGLAEGGDKECAYSLVDEVRKLAKSVGQPLAVKDTDIKRDDYMKAMPGLVDRAVNEAPTIAITRVPEADDLEKMFVCAYDGTPCKF